MLNVKHHCTYHISVHLWLVILGANYNTPCKISLFFLLIIIEVINCFSCSVQMSMHIDIKMSFSCLKPKETLHCIYHAFYYQNDNTCIIISLCMKIVLFSAVRFSSCSYMSVEHNLDHLVISRLSMIAGPHRHVPLRHDAVPEQLFRNPVTPGVRRPSRILMS